MSELTLLGRLGARDREMYRRWVAVDATVIGKRFWRTVTHLGGAPFTISVALAHMLLDGPSVSGIGAQAVATLALTHLAAIVLKRAISRPRPSGFSFEALIAIPRCFSFPSGHSIAASSLAFVYTWHAPALAPLLLVLAALAGVSRVKLGVHYPGDVVAGQLVALAGATAVIWVL